MAKNVKVQVTYCSYFEMADNCKHILAICKCFTVHILFFLMECYKEFSQVKIFYSYQSALHEHAPLFHAQVGLVDCLGFTYPEIVCV